MIQKEGAGWRLARDPARTAFPVLIGGESWAVELTQAEWKLLMALIVELTDQHQQLVTQLLAEESVCLEMERQSWWACLDGDRHAARHAHLLRDHLGDLVLALLDVGGERGEDLRTFGGRRP